MKYGSLSILLSCCCDLIVFNYLVRIKKFGDIIVPKRKTGIAGKASTGRRIQAVQIKLVNVFTTRLAPELGVDTLGNFLKEKINYTVTCRKIDAERSRFGSFHISAICKNVEDMYDPETVMRMLDLKFWEQKS